MTKPTPTEEQRRAAADIVILCLASPSDAASVDHVAALLAEREAPLWAQAEGVASKLRAAEAEVARLNALVTEEARLIVERDHARANLATLQREHDALTRSTEAARAAIAQALGLTEWRALADLAAEVAKLAAERDDLTRLAAQYEDNGRKILDESESLRAALSSARAELDEARYDVANDVRLDEVVAALAASRAEVEALQAAARDVLAVDGGPPARVFDLLLLNEARRRLAALSSTPAPASAEPATPTTSPVCSTCGDTHLMWHSNLEREVMCTRCPTPCRKCAAGGGFGPYCAKTPCVCSCHATSTTEGGAK